MSYGDKKNSSRFRLRCRSRSFRSSPSGIQHGPCEVLRRLSACKCLPHLPLGFGKKLVADQKSSKGLLPITTSQSVIEQYEVWGLFSSSVRSDVPLLFKCPTNPSWGVIGPYCRRRDYFVHALHAKLFGQG